MGFPMGYPDLFLPRLLLNLVFFLGHLRRILYWAFTAVGLGDLLDSDAPWPEHHHLAGDGRRHPEFRSVSAMLIQEVLPVVSYDDLVREGGGHVAAGECAVCLYELQGGDEVRRLSNCRHVFHRGCLDRWIEHDQRTCPLCRAPLLPEEMMQDDGLNGCVWAAAGIPDSFDGLESFSSFPIESSSSQDLFLPQNLLGRH